MHTSEIKEMAKQTVTKRPPAPKKKQVKKGKKRPVSVRREPSKMDHALIVANLLNDPCGAPLPPPFLAGENGMVSRFVLDGTIVGAGNTAAYLAFHPNTGWTVSNSAVASFSGIPAADFSINASNSPGFNFLATNAAKVRGLAGCLTVLPSSLSITNITGEIAVSSISPDALRTLLAVGHNVDQVAAYTNARTAIERRAYDTKFKPGSFDGKYSTYQNTGNISGTGTDLSDTNAILVTVRGLPVGASIAIRFTWVCEWVPKFNLGLTPTVSNTPLAIDHMAVGASLDKHKPNWWNNLAHTVEDTLGPVAAKVGKSAQMYMQSAASNFLADAVETLLIL